jgi:hypothetical protein
MEEKLPFKQAVIRASFRVIIQGSNNQQLQNLKIVW